MKIWIAFLAVYAAALAGLFVACSPPPPPPEPAETVALKCRAEAGLTLGEVLERCGEPCSVGTVDEFKGWVAWRYCLAGCGCEWCQRSHVVVFSGGEVFRTLTVIEQ